MTVSKDDAKARWGFCALLLAGLGILAVGKWTDTLALKDGLWRRWCCWREPGVSACPGAFGRLH